MPPPTTPPNTLPMVRLRLTRDRFRDGDVIPAGTELLIGAAEAAEILVDGAGVEIGKPRRRPEPLFQWSGS